MNKEFILALKQLEKEKGIDAYIIMEAIEAALKVAWEKQVKLDQINIFN